MPNVEPADEKVPEPFFISVKKDAYQARLSAEAVAAHAPWEWESAHSEKPVKILSYLGSLSNTYGSDGDFYVDEMTNLLYGPKKNGLWPDEGVLAAGICKRTWIAFTRKRFTPRPVKRGTMWRLKSFLRLLLPVRLLKSIASLGPNS